MLAVALVCQRRLAADAADPSALLTLGVVALADRQVEQAQIMAKAALAAEPGCAMGFCLFANVAVAARWGT